MRIINSRCKANSGILNRMGLWSSGSVLAMTVLICACGGESTVQTSSSSGDNRTLSETVSDTFSMYDTNNDGYLDRHEFVKFQQDPAIIRLQNQTTGLRKGALLFDEIDGNGDDRISEQEMRMAVSGRGGR